MKIEKIPIFSDEGAKIGKTAEFMENFDFWKVLGKDAQNAIKMLCLSIVGQISKSYQFFHNLTDH